MGHKFVTNWSLILLLTLFWGGSSVVSAEDGFQKPSPVAQYQDRTLDQVTISAVRENMFIINGENYISTNQTIITKQVDGASKPVTIEEISFPSRARITFQIYFVVDEAHPFQKNDMVLTTVSIY